MEVYYSSQFKKQYRALSQKIRNQFNKRSILFFKNQIDPQLHIHKLRGKYQGLYSINITGDVRTVFDNSYKNTILFVAIGTHSILYS
ncbi:MAG: type II toxin-antitoxin system mRNA interferase toxin, RelE/StbE family [Candidatus Pacebacteria bacterium]|nr:type II toxin-antitoxin system mRNA interferase toxin, RelE/StbE family [Candidatus Paceibacterota bacterium]